MAQPLTMYTTPWCAFCKRLKRQLAADGIEMTEIDIEQDPAAADYVMSVNGGFPTVPTVVFPDGNALPNPSAPMVQGRLREFAALCCPGNDTRPNRARSIPPPRPAPAGAR